MSKVLPDGDRGWWKLVLDTRTEHRVAEELGLEYYRRPTFTPLGCEYVLLGFSTKAKAERVEAKVLRHIAQIRKEKQRRLRKLHKPNRKG